MNRLLTRGETGRLASRWRDIAGFRIHERHAPGPAGATLPPIVLVHGFGVSSRYFVPTALRLARHTAVFAPDLPGFGRSERPQRALRLSELVDVLAAYVDAAGLDRAALVGNSFGCQLVAELAVRRPERVAAAVLVGPTVDPRARTAPRQLARLLGTAVFEPPGLWLIVAAEYVVFGPRRTLVTLREMLRDRIEEKLPRVAAPTSVVRGARDVIVPQRWAEEAAELLSCGRLAVVPRVGHAVNYAAPRALERLVVELLCG